MRVLFNGYSVLLVVFLLAAFIAIGLISRILPVFNRTVVADTRSYEQILTEESPREALLKLSQDTGTNAEVANNCHPLAHELGRLAYEKYGSYEQAAVFQQAVCNSGYIHGVLERRLSESQNMSEDLQSLCTQPFKSRYEQWQCFHGIGHGIMYYTNNNLPLSLQYCKELEDPSKQQSCANGIYMENFVSNSFHPSTFVRDDDLFYPCSDPAFPFREDCYYYAPTRMLVLNNNNYLDAYAFCNELKGTIRGYCVEGVAGQATKNNYADISKVEELCKQFNESDLHRCVTAMVDMYINMKGSTDDGMQVCESLATDMQKSCVDELLIKERDFTRL